MTDDVASGAAAPRRSDGTRQTLRPTKKWPKDKSFKILSIDGGGILGLLPCLVLAELERRFLEGEPIGQHFDLLVGTSTGGIIALGLGQNKSAQDISKLYTERGHKIFPGNFLTRPIRRLVSNVLVPYSLANLERELRREFGDKLFGSASNPTCIPAFEGQHGEPYLFKTPHHEDYKKDLHEKLVTVGLATAAAPTYFASMKRDGYIFVDGGIWANNPAMVGVVEAISCFGAERTQIKLLSLGCGQEKFRMRWWHRIGGSMVWAKQFYISAMRVQSHNALGQARLMIGNPNLVRLDAPEVTKQIGMDNVKRAVAELPGVARALVDSSGHRIEEMFLRSIQPVDRIS